MVVPLPGTLSINRWPPDWRTNPKVMDRPSPVPLPRGLVVKKGSTARRRTSSGMPVPVSRMISAA